MLIITIKKGAISEICAITGHTEDDVYQVLKHYRAINGEIADSTVAKLLAYEEQKGHPAERITN